MASFAENSALPELWSSRPERRRAPAVASFERLLVHDYSGHPFQVQLSRELASRGYEVLHLHCPSYRSGKGALERSPADPESLWIDEVRLPTDFDKYSLWRRPVQERTYARRLIERVRQFSPNVVLSSNTPLIAQRMFQRECRRAGIPFVFWHQDLYSVPIMRALETQIPVLGRLLGSAVSRLEAVTLRQSDGVVSISEDFVPQLARWGAERNLQVIENWAPVDELPVLPRHNDWSRLHGLDDGRVLLYSGTLGVKHNPELLLRLARRFRDDPDVAVVVISEGVGAKILAEAAADEPLSNLIVLPFQPYERLAEVLASADVLLAVLETDAGVFAVPSKVLTYLCAGRPLLAAIPSANLAAKTIVRSGGGVVVDPDDPEGFAAAAVRLLSDPVRRRRYGEDARAYAEATFDITRVADRFEAILGSAFSDSRDAARVGAAR